ncbi:YgjP-like metallopeptidase domain-containing protein [Mycoplasma sp. ATU-Cv-508]|uniref:YgjP-like metallopeptidase domain-containing protein n=1 Tax=Mycoplasma sp. ATU-Cv-508 TaxID=2048001 RepID=UPI000FDE4891
MKGFSLYHAQTWHYVEIKRTNNRRMYFQLTNGKLVVSVPEKMDLELARQFVSEKLPRFVSAKTKQLKNTKVNLNQQTLVLHGQMYRFDSLTGYPKNALKISGSKVYIQTSQGSNSQIISAIKTYLKTSLEKHLLTRLSHWIKKMATGPYEFRVSDKRATWASNNLQKRRISFSSRLTHFDQRVIDYVIVHELAHHFHPHHQNEFWKLVADYIPDYQSLRQQMRFDN